MWDSTDAMIGILQEEISQLSATLQQIIIDRDTRLTMQNEQIAALTKKLAIATQQSDTMLTFYQQFLELRETIEMLTKKYGAAEETIRERDKEIRSATSQTAKLIETHAQTIHALKRTISKQADTIIGHKEADEISQRNITALTTERDRLQEENERLQAMALTQNNSQKENAGAVPRPLNAAFTPNISAFGLKEVCTKLQAQLNTQTQRETELREENARLRLELKRTTLGKQNAPSSTSPNDNSLWSSSSPHTAPAAPPTTPVEPTFPTTPLRIIF